MTGKLISDGGRTGGICRFTGGTDPSMMKLPTRTPGVGVVVKYAKVLGYNFCIQT